MAQYISAGDSIHGVGAISPAALLQRRDERDVHGATRAPGPTGRQSEEIIFPSPSGTTAILGAIPVSVRALITPRGRMAPHSAARCRRERPRRLAGQRSATS